MRKKVNLLHKIIFVTVLAATAVISPAQTTAPSPERVAIATKRVLTPKAGLGDRVRVEIDKLSEAVAKNQIDPRKLLLYLDGRPIKGAYAESVDPSGNVLEFQLRRTAESRDAWTDLLGSPKASTRRVTVSVGLESEREIPALDPKNRPTLNLVVFHKNWFKFCVAALLFTLFLFVQLAKSSTIIRDSNPPKPPPGEMKPYSLARLQMAVWFFLIVGSFLFIYLITGDYNTITEQALMLMGISAGTALGAAAVDSNKRTVADSQLEKLRPERSKLDAQIQETSSKISNLQSKTAGSAPASPDEIKTLSDLKVELAEKQSQLKEIDAKINEASSGLTEPVSEGFFKDLLTDVNGVSLHRFQMLVWTIVLGFLFCLGVYQSLAMPQFSATLLALIGISAGTYLGFKIPERQT